MVRLGQTDAAFTHAMRRDDGDRDRLRALVERRDWAPFGTGRANQPPNGLAAETPDSAESPADAAPSDDGRGWVRTSDLSRVKRALSH